MPNKYMRGATYVHPQLITFDPSKIIALIEKKMQAAVNMNIARAMQVAQARVPVRKVFKGGRQNSRAMTHAELREEALTWLSTLSVHERALISGRVRRASSPGMGLVDALANVRAGTRTRVGWNRANRGTQADLDRIVTPAHMIPGTEARGSSQFRTVTQRDEPGVIQYTQEGPNWKPRVLESEFRSDARRGLTTGRAYFDDEKRQWRPSAIGNYIISVQNRSILNPKFALGGNLKRSLRYDKSGGGRVGIYVEIVAGGVDAPYAKYVEFGTRHAMAQPFLRPAFMQVVERFQSDVRLGLLDLAMKYPVR